MLITDLEKIINQKLKSERFNDYTPNGLQVLGKSNVQKIVTGVTACQRLLDKAVALDADAILVHHGYFWKNESVTVTGIKQKRLKTLLMHDINLLSYHLPLDAHPELGNNAQIAKSLDITLFPRRDITDILFSGSLSSATTGFALKNKLEDIFAHTVLHSGDSKKKIQTLAFCSGGGQDYIEEAAQQGVDAFLTGEVSERTIHIAREYGIHFFAAGHHATERGGIKALGQWLAEYHDLDVTFIDIDNPA